MRRALQIVTLVGMAATSMACAGASAEGAGQKQPMGKLTVSRLQNPEDAPAEAKTIQVDYAFRNDLLTKDFTKTYKDGFDKHGVKVDQQLVTKTHFDVKDARITGTVTYVKKGWAHYSILEANLVATGHYDADVQVDLDVQAKGDTKKAQKELSGTILGGKPIPIVKNMMPTNIPIAGPLFVHAHFDLSASCEMDAAGAVHATTGVGVAGDVRLAANYKKAGFDKGDGKKSKFSFEAKTPNFNLSPKPYVRVEGKEQKVHGKCSLQPTTVVLMEKMIGAKLSVEPYVEMSAERASSKAKWNLDAQAGVSLNAATDVQFMGRQIGKPKEFTLFDLALTKKGDALAAAPERAKASAVAEVVAEQTATAIGADSLPPSDDDADPKADVKTVKADASPATNVTPDAVKVDEKPVVAETPKPAAVADAPKPIENKIADVKVEKVEAKVEAPKQDAQPAEVKPADPAPVADTKTDIAKPKKKDDEAPKASADILGDALGPAPEPAAKKPAKKKPVAKKAPAPSSDGTTPAPAAPKKKKPVKKKDAA